MAQIQQPLGDKWRGLREEPTLVEALKGAESRSGVRVGLIS